MLSLNIEVIKRSLRMYYSFVYYLSMVDNLRGCSNKVLLALDTLYLEIRRKTFFFPFLTRIQIQIQNSAL